MYATPARNIIPMRENERRWRCRRGKEEKRLPIGRGTRTPRKKEGLGNGIQQGNTTLWPIDQWLAIIVSSLEQHVSTFLPSPSPLRRTPATGFPSLVLLSDVLHLPSSPASRRARKKSPRPARFPLRRQPAGPKTPSREAEIATFRAKRRNYLTL